MASAQSPWIVRASLPGARIKLFCIPHAGGTTALFRGWRKALPGDVELCPIQLPGRLTHIQRPPFTRMEPLASALAQVIHAETAGIPYALFGHCTGALVAYEVAQRLNRHQPPLHLFASCCRAPHLPDPDPPLAHLDDAALIAEVRALGGTATAVLDNPSMVRLLLPALRADFQVAESYLRRRQPVLDCALTVFGGDRDVLSQEELERWRPLVAGAFSARLFPGGHFLLDTAEAQVIDAIAQALGAGGLPEGPSAASEAR